MEEKKEESIWGSAEEFKFVPESGEIPGGERGVLYGIVAGITLWGLFGPGKKKENK